MQPEEKETFGKGAIEPIYLFFIMLFLYNERAFIYLLGNLS